MKSDAQASPASQHLRTGGPNILFLLTDNQRADLVGCAGNRIIHTPNLDLLGYRGVRFANAFATTPVCAASRASYLTGLYERRHQFTFYTPPLRREFSDISYPALLKAAGYHTGFIGKFGVAVNGIEPSLEDPGGLERMFDHFDQLRALDRRGVRDPPARRRDTPSHRHHRRQGGGVHRPAVCRPARCRGRASGPSVCR